MSEPRYHLTAVAEMLRLSPNIIRRYERSGVLRGQVVAGKRLYSDLDVLRVRRILSVTGLGVNLAGADVVCNLLDRIDSMEAEIVALREQLRRLLED
ncbi:MAG: MerR family transcriptional regulator [Armatimonadetes bacterium]|nr:MerR family transcriptional regulator [Armatimonadota bacterium]